MRVTVEPPEGWGPTRVLIVQLERLGYEVIEWRVEGRSVLELAAKPPATG